MNNLISCYYNLKIISGNLSDTEQHLRKLRLDKAQNSNKGRIVQRFSDRLASVKSLLSDLESTMEDLCNDAEDLFNEIDQGRDKADLFLNKKLLEVRQELEVLLNDAKNSSSAMPREQEIIQQRVELDSKLNS